MVHVRLADEGIADWLKLKRVKIRDTPSATSQTSLRLRGWRVSSLHSRRLKPRYRNDDGTYVSSRLQWTLLD